MVRVFTHSFVMVAVLAFMDIIDKQVIILIRRGHHIQLVVIVDAMWLLLLLQRRLRVVGIALKTKKSSVFHRIDSNNRHK